MEVRNTLKRYPERKNELLQAWDGADELLIEHLNELDLAGQKILVLNDGFGALGCALEGHDFDTYTDSFLSTQGMKLNGAKPERLIHHLDELSGPYDYALIKIPKNLSFFEDVLCHISGHLKPAATVVCGYMVKYQNKSMFELLDKTIGKTSTSLARKKARLIFSSFERSPSKSPYPIRVKFDGFEKPFENQSGLFSREGLDIGTRFLLEHIPQGDYRTTLDLGCANGVVGIAAKKLNTAAQLTFTDESAMAIQSAEANYRNYFSDEARFIWTHACDGVPDASMDLVICNPPFHQGNTVGDFTAWQMFTDAKRVLVDGGVLRIIGNSHLQHQVALKKIFGNFEFVAKNSRFTIIDAIR